MKTHFEYIVVGCGGIGSAAAYWLARRAGSEVLGLEQYRLGHDNGGSQDHSRIIRLSYHAPEYTALTPHTYTAWAEVEAESGVQLVVKTGGLDIGENTPAGANAVDLYATSMQASNIPFEDLTAAEAMQRWPQFRLDGEERVLYQPDSGLVDARKGNATHVALARARGATIFDQTAVQCVRPVGETVEVDTAAGRFVGRHLVVTCGSWTNNVLRDVGLTLPITVTQEQVTYYATPNLRDFAADRFPIWIWHGDDAFYGFPVYGEVATKAGQDVGGDVVTAETRTFEPDPRAFRKLQRFLEQRIPGSLGPVLYTKSCLYDMPPDRDFIIDTLPDQPRITIAVGAGHAYKFASLIGRILSELAIDGKAGCPIEAFALGRPALTDPSFPPSFHI
jgi:sarcosine oxidase